MSGPMTAHIPALLLQDIFVDLAVFHDQLEVVLVIQHHFDIVQRVTRVTRQDLFLLLTTFDPVVFCRSNIIAYPLLIRGRYMTSVFLNRIPDRLASGRSFVRDFGIPDNEVSVDDHMGNAGRCQSIFAFAIGRVVCYGFRIKDGDVGHHVHLHPSALLHVLKACIAKMKGAPVTQL